MNGARPPGHEQVVGVGDLEVLDRDLADDEVVDPLVEASDGEIAALLVVPFAGQIEVGRLVGLEVGVAAARLQVAGAQVGEADARREQRQVRAGDGPRSPEARRQIVGDVELDVQAGQEVVIARLAPHRRRTGRIDDRIGGRIAADRAQIEQDLLRTVRGDVGVDIAEAEVARDRQAGEFRLEIALDIAADDALADLEAVGVADRGIAIVGGQEGTAAADRQAGGEIGGVSRGIRFEEGEIGLGVEAQPLAREVAAFAAQEIAGVERLQQPGRNADRITAVGAADIVLGPHQGVRLGQVLKIAARLDGADEAAIGAERRIEALLENALAAVEAFAGSEVGAPDGRIGKAVCRGDAGQAVAGIAEGDRVVEADDGKDLLAAIVRRRLGPARIERHVDQVGRFPFEIAAERKQLGRAVERPADIVGVAVGVLAEGGDGTLLSNRSSADADSRWARRSGRCCWRSS